MGNRESKIRRGIRSAPVPGLILFFLSISTAWGGDNLSPRLHLGFNASGVGLSGLAADSPVFSPEIEASLQISDSWGAVVSGGITEFAVRFDTPAGDASMPVRTWWLESGVRYLTGPDDDPNAAAEGLVGLVRDIVQRAHDLGFARSAGLPHADAKDAARYRWWRERWTAGDDYALFEELNQTLRDASSPEAVDRDIDAAIARPDRSKA